MQGHQPVPCEAVRQRCVCFAWYCKVHVHFLPLFAVCGEHISQSPDERGAAPGHFKKDAGDLMQVACKAVVACAG
jgi:hypothetical protein